MERSTEDTRLKRRLVGPVFIVAALLSLGWWLNRLTQPEEIRQPGAGRSPDSYAEGLVIRAYDDQGELRQRLLSQSMRYFEDTGITELRRPIFRQYTHRGSPWTMQADQGFIRRIEGSLYLPGPVVIDRPGSTESAPLHIITRELTLFFDDSFATTKASVRIESDEQWMTATGMEAWFKEPVRLKLLHDVRGYYEFN
jgi:lipopolysaccharide export system protein LptC